MIASRRLFFWSLLLIVPGLMLGCETGVDPFVGEDRPFTIWGLMNAGADTQKVRVFTIAGAPGIDRSGGIDAAVASVDLTTGERREWAHRQLTYEDGDVGHVFWSPFRAQTGHRYRLEVTRSDGATSTATTTVPPDVEVELDEHTTSAKFPVYIRGDVPNLLDVEMRYEATNLPPVYVWPEDRTVHPPVAFPVDVSYQGTGDRIPGGFRFDIDMQKDFEIVRDTYLNNCLVTAGAPDIALARVEFHFITADSAWSPPGGTFDPDVLVEPGVFSNIENGYGFFGAGKIVAVRWTPPQLLRMHLGYRYDRPCANAAAPIQACMEPPVPCFGGEQTDLWDSFF